jgi:hypothetical protein
MNESHETTASGDTAKQGEKERIKTGDELAKIFHEQVDRIKKETWNAAIDRCKEAVNRQFEESF